MEPKIHDGRFNCKDESVYSNFRYLLYKFNATRVRAGIDRRMFDFSGTCYSVPRRQTGMLTAIPERVCVHGSGRPHQNGTTPLSAAARGTDLKAARLLLKNSAAKKMNAVNTLGKTALDRYLHNTPCLPDRDEDLVQLMRELGAMTMK
jgi:hypothetical protein